MKKLELGMLLTALLSLAIVTGCGSSSSTNDFEPPELVEERPNVVINNIGDGKVIFVNGDGDIYECYDLNASGDACTNSVYVDSYYEAPIIEPLQ